MRPTPYDPPVVERGRRDLRGARARDGVREHGAGIVLWSPGLGEVLVRGDDGGCDHGTGSQFGSAPRE